ncbi:MAG: hypothetical protein ABIA76_03735 [Candidatus Diapherotrites archaeon]
MNKKIFLGLLILLSLILLINVYSTAFNSDIGFTKFYMFDSENAEQTEEYFFSSDAVPTLKMEFSQSVNYRIELMDSETREILETVSTVNPSKEGEKSFDKGQGNYTIRVTLNPGGNETIRETGFAVVSNPKRISIPETDFLLVLALLLAITAIIN